MSSVVLSPSTGQSISISPLWTEVTLNPSTPLARLKLVLPSFDGHDGAFVLQSSKTIANFDVDISTARKISGLPVQIPADEALTFVYTAIVRSWSVAIGGTLDTNYGASTYYVLGTNPLVIEVDPTGKMESADLAFILRQGQLVGLNLSQLRPPSATILGGDGLGSFTSLSLGPTLTIVDGKLSANIGTASGSVAAGDVLAATQALASAALPTAGGTMAGTLILAGDPTSGLAAATKQYVDGALSSIAATASSALAEGQVAVTISGAAMPRAGGTFTGPITLPAAPTLPLHAATRSYVDTAITTATSNALAALAAATSAQTTASAALVKTANLNDLPSPAAARLALGLGTAAVFSIGQGHGSVAAGDDPRLLGALQATILGTPGGIATLDIYGRLNASQIPLTLLGAMVYQGTWNSSTNVPLLQSGIGTKGQYFVVAVSSTNTTLDGVKQWNVGDWAVFDGVRWDKLDGIASEVLSILGYTGSITLPQLVASGVAPLDSPAFINSPTAPTPAASSNSTTIPTTAWVTTNFLKSSGGSLTGATLDNSVIGQNTPNTARFTTITLTTGQTGSAVLAAPAAGGAPVFRQLAAADISGLGTLAIQNGSNVAITGGSIDGVAIGSTTAGAGRFTALAVTGSQTAKFVLAAPNASAGAPTWRQLVQSDISGLGTLATQDASTVAVTGGTLDGTTVGATAPAAGTFTTLATTSSVLFGASSSVVMSGATSGSMGAGTINARGLYVNGQAVGLAGGYNLPAATTTQLGGVILPATTGAAGSNLTVDGSGNVAVVWSAPGSIGATTPNAGAFTTLSSTGSLTVGGTGYLQIPVGTTGQRPGTPAQGQMRFNTTTVRNEFYDGTTFRNYVRLDGDVMLGTLSLTSIACTGGSIDGTAIGATSPASAAFTSLTATAGVTLTSTASMVVGSATGGSKGAGSINAVGLFVNGVAVSTASTSIATTTAAGTVIIPTTGGLLIDVSGNLSINWASPGAIGGTAAAAATFTTLTLTSTVTSKFVLAGPNGANGAPTWRQLLASDISGLGSLATQSASTVAITGGNIDSTPIGSNTASTGRFTTLTLTSAQTAGYVLAAPSAGGVPTFRALTATDVSGLGSMATQSGSNVNITGGSISGVSLTSVGSAAFGSSLGTKLALYGTTYGMGIANNEVNIFMDGGSALRLRTGSPSGTAALTADVNGIQATQIGASLAASGRFTTVVATAAGSSIPGIPTSNQVAPTGATLMLNGTANAGSYYLTGNSPFAFTIQSITVNTGTTSNTGFNVALLVNGTAASLNGNTLQGNYNGTSTYTVTGASAVPAGGTVVVAISAFNGAPANPYISIVGVRTGLN